MLEGWYDFAIRLDGPAEKTGYSGGQKTHAKVGIVLHSMEYESTPEWDDATTLHNALFSDREASWTFSICKFFGGAMLYQHYPIGTVCWAQGYEGNLWLDSVETETVAPHKFTEAQVALVVKLLGWIKSERQEWLNEVWAIGTRQDWIPVSLGGLLFEHNAVPGAPATNCAVFTHGQVDPQRLLADLEEGDMAEDPRLTRILEKGAEKAQIEADFGAWMNAYGVPAIEDQPFVAFVNKHIAWRLRGKSGWVVPN